MIELIEAPHAAAAYRYAAGSRVLSDHNSYDDLAFRDLSDAWFNSSAFTSLAPRTRHDYAAAKKRIDEEVVMLYWMAPFTNA